MSNNKKYMLQIIEQLNSIREDLIRGQDNHIAEFHRNGFTTSEALKDWQDNLSRILRSIDEVVLQLRDSLRENR